MAKRELYINFLDFEKAFDSIHQESLWILRAYGIPAHFVDLFKLFYEDYTSTVGQSDIPIAFRVMSGVRQGCVMSSLLFNLSAAEKRH